MWHFLITDLVPPADDRAEHLRPRLPGLESRLAGGRRVATSPSWRHELVVLAEAACPSGAAGRKPGESPPRERSSLDWPTGADLAAAAGCLHEAPAWAVVSPVRMAAGLDHVQLGQVLPPLATEVVADFNRDFGATDGVLVPSGSHLLWALPQPWAVTASDPQGLSGHDVGPRLPQGVDAARVRRWMTEAQMWLHAKDSPGGANALWPWGFGDASAVSPRPAWPWPVEGADDWVRAWPTAPGTVTPGTVTHGSAGGSRVVLWRLADHAGPSGAFAAADIAWCAAIDAALAAVGHVSVWLAGTRHELRASDRWHFWRRWHTPRPWWQ